MASELETIYRHHVHHNSTYFKYSAESIPTQNDSLSIINKKRSTVQMCRKAIKCSTFYRGVLNDNEIKEFKLFYVRLHCVLE